MLAAGPLRTQPLTTTRDIFDHLMDIRDAATKVTSLSVVGRDFSVSVGRNAHASPRVQERERHMAKKATASKDPAKKA